LVKDHVGSHVFSTIKPLDSARCELVKKAKESGASHIFFWDDDIVLPSETIERLLQHDRDIVTGLYFKRLAPYTPVVYDKENDKRQYRSFVDYPDDGRLIDVKAAGLGCMLIKLDVFDSIVSDWFRWGESRGSNKDLFVGEDIWFCEQARQAGFRVYLDSGLKCGHVGELVVTEKMFR